jgi:hypothetical protein
MRKSEQIIQSYIDNQSLVKVYYFDEEYDSVILANSQDLMLLAESREFSFEQYIIVIKNNIKRIKYGRLQKFHEHLLNTYSNAAEINNLEWLDISSYPATFQTLKDNYNRICVYSKDKNIDAFDIGQITKVADQRFGFNVLTLYGEITKDEYTMPYDQITHISFGDEYSRILFDYAKGAIRVK